MKFRCFINKVVSIDVNLSETDVDLPLLSNKKSEHSIEPKRLTLRQVRIFV